MNIDGIVKIISICKSLQDKGYEITHCDDSAIVFTKDTIFKKHCIGFDLKDHKAYQYWDYPSEEVKKIFSELSKILHENMETEVEE